MSTALPVPGPIRPQWRRDAVQADPLLHPRGGTDCGLWQGCCAAPPWPATAMLVMGVASQGWAVMMGPGAEAASPAADAALCRLCACACLDLPVTGWGTG